MEKPRVAARLINADTALFHLPIVYFKHTQGFLKILMSALIEFHRVAQRRAESSIVYTNLSLRTNT